jgi:hypothetical protein
MTDKQVGAGLALGVIAIIVAWLGNTYAPSVVTAVNDAIVEAQIVLGFFGVAIGATVIGGTALNNARNADVSMEAVRAPALVGLLGAVLLLSAARVPG